MLNYWFDNGLIILIHTCPNKYKAKGAQMKSVEDLLLISTQSGFYFHILGKIFKKLALEVRNVFCAK